MKRGFTLIELLVVVLIIGILAAVALPQYRVAVAKSHIGSYMGVARSFGNAQEVYYLENGEYARLLQDLAVTPESCTYDTTGGNLIWNCGNAIQIDNSIDYPGSKVVGNIIIRYCPGYNTSFKDCAAHRELQLNFFLSHPRNEGKPWRAPNTILCEAYTDLGRKVCKSMGINIY